MSGKTIVENAPVGSKGSNGVIERAVQEIEGEIRAIFIGLQERLGLKLGAQERIISYIPEYAAYLLNRLHKGQDGKVPYERVKGKKPTVLGVEFGEKVLFKKKRGNKLEKINERFEYGIFVGVNRKSNELLICNQEGLHEVRTISRIPEEKRWSSDCVDWIKWVPWHRYKDARDSDGDVPEGVKEERSPREGEGQGAPGGGVVFVPVGEKVPRDVYISKKDAEKHGYTSGCPGCNSWFRGLSRQPHTPGCRKRFSELMKEDAKVLNYQARKREFEERQKSASGSKRKVDPDVPEREDPRVCEQEAMDPSSSSSGNDMEVSEVEIMNLIGEWVSEIESAEIGRAHV